MKKELEIYIHIPFCVKKCAYCDFLSGPQNAETIEKYVEMLIQEISVLGRHYPERMISTIFFGGGTPSILSGRQMASIMEALKTYFHILTDVEISMEVNPGTVTKEKLEAYKKAGINRISFGLQSANNDDLRVLGRIHTYEDFLESFQLARECGFDNINVDLISAIPNQNLKSWEKSLTKIIQLNPEHISAYSLIIEEGTPFYKIYGEGSEKEIELPDEEEEREIYHRTEVLLNQAGYQRYEISNYAKPGKECQHNLGYWERKDYLGIGLGSSSLMENVRFKNTDDLQYYIQNAGKLEVIREEREELSETQQMEEFVFLGLRKMQGISIRKFEEDFGKSLCECYGENIERIKKEGLLEESDGVLRLTQKGIDISNYVFAEILY